MLEETSLSYQWQIATVTFLLNHGRHAPRLFLCLCFCSAIMKSSDRWLSGNALHSHVLPPSSFCLRLRETTTERNRTMWDQFRIRWTITYYGILDTAGIGNWLAPVCCLESPGPVLPNIYSAEVAVSGITYTSWPVPSLISSPTPLRRVAVPSLSR